MAADHPKMVKSQRTKINELLTSQPPGSVFLSKWLIKQGYSYDLQQYYKKSQWLESIGHGAVIRAGTKVDLASAIYALQQQAGTSIHTGGRTAFSWLGRAHYLEMNPSWVVLFGGENEQLPAWVKNFEWGFDIDYFGTSFMPSALGLQEFEQNHFKILISSLPRAMMECLYLAPNHQELFECYELMEGLTSLVPNKVQALLEQCKSIKVKRLFLYMAEEHRHSWLEHIDLKNIDLGKGKRSFAKNGIYIPKYQITLPREFINEDKDNPF